MIKKWMVASLIAAATMGSASASTIALSWSGTGADGTSAYTRGWAFSSNAAINVTSLGWFDFDNDGLNASHQVGIWDMSGNLIISGTVAAGAADPLLSGFRYTNALSGATTLAAGDYVVAGLSSVSDVGWRYVDPAAVTMGAEISYIEDRSSGDTDFGYAWEYDGYQVGYFGANFQYDAVTDVPEPAALSLSLLGLGLLGCLHRSRRRTMPA